MKYQVNNIVVIVWSFLQQPWTCIFPFRGQGAEPENKTRAVANTGSVNKDCM